MRSAAIAEFAQRGVVVIFVQIGALRLRWSHAMCLVRRTLIPYKYIARHASESRSDLFAPVAKLQLELPALESCHHAAEFAP